MHYFIPMPEVHMSLATPAKQSNLLKSLSAIWAWIFLGILIVFFEIWARALGTTFLFNLTSVQNILLAAVQPLLIGLGMTLVIIAGGIDLSVGFTVGLAAVMSALLMNVLDPGLPPVLSFLLASVLALASAAVIGLVNGFMIARWNVPPFIGTLGMYGVARGVAYLIAVGSGSGSTVPTTNPVSNEIGNGYVLGLIPTPVFVTVLIVFFLHYLLSKTRFGQYTYAIGGNRNAAIRAGIYVERHTIMLYILTAILAGVAGVLYTGRFTAGAAQAGEPTLLNAIAAVVIGGASLFGGEGTITGTVIGALIIAVIEFGLVFINVQAYWQFIAVGAVIILSVLVDQARRSAVKS
jgi:predicted ABC-type sugar transport system permease subunit